MSRTSSASKPLRSAALATTVALLAGLLSVVGFAAPASAATASLSVVVTSPTGAPFAAKRVWAEEIVDGLAGYSISGTTVSAANGSYFVSNLTVGSTYAIGVQTTAAGTYSQYLGGATVAQEAELVTITSGTNTLSFGMAAGVSVTGVAKKSTGTAATDVLVLPYYFDGSNWVEWWNTNNTDDAAKTSATGAYTVKGLQPGSYKFWFYSLTGTAGPNGFPGGTTLETAKSYYLAPGTTTALNYTFAAYGSISGTIVGSGSAIGETWVTAHRLTGNPTDGFTAAEQASSAYSNATTGKFSIAGLAAGYYSLSYSPPWGSPYPQSFIGGLTSLSSTVITVTAGKSTAAPLWTASTTPAAGSISGTVYYLGHPVTGKSYRVQVIRQGAATGVDPIQTQMTTGGSYSLTNLAPGDYTLGIDPYCGDSCSTFMPQSMTVTVGSGPVARDIVLTPFTALTVVDSPSIDGISKVGKTLFANPGLSSVGTAIPTFQWYREEAGGQGRPIRGATGQYYTLQPSDIGAQVSVRVLYTLTIDGGARYYEIYQTSVSRFSNKVTVAPGAQPINLAPPQIVPNTGIAIGTVLRATNGSWNTPGLEFSYGWLADGSPIEGADERTYTVTAATTNKSITVAVAGGAPGYVYSDFVSSPPVTGALGAAPTVKVAPVITKPTATSFKVSTGTWSTTGISFQYHWYENGVGQSVIANSFTPALASSSVVLVISATKTGYLEGSRRIVVRKGTAQPSVAMPPIVTDTGASVQVGTQEQTVKAGTVLTVSPGSFDYPDPIHAAGARTFVWQSSVNGTTWTAIPKATTASYTVATTDLNKKLRVVVTVPSTDYQPLAIPVIAGTGVLRSGLLDVGANPTITGTGTVGSTFTAFPAPYPVGTTFTYKWEKSSNGGSTYQVIAGATAKTYLVKPADSEAFTFRAIVTANKAGFTSDSRTSDLGYGNGYLLQNVTPLIVSPTGSVKAGTVLSSSGGVWNVPGVTLAYTWYSDGNLIGGATAKTFTTTAAEVGTVITSKVSVTKAGYTPPFSVPTSNGVGVTAAVILNTAPPTFSPNGFAKAGALLTATPGSWDVPGVTVSYKWYSNGSLIPGAGAKTFTLTAAQVGTTVTVTAAAAKLGYTPTAEAGSVQQVSVRPAAIGAAPTPVEFSLGATVKVGAVLTSPSTDVYALFTYPVSPAPATVAYQWFQGATAIAGATSSAYTVRAADLGKVVKLRVTASSAYYVSKSFTTGGTTVVAADAPVGTATLSFAGVTIKPGTKVTATLGAFTPTGSVYSYQWQRSADLSSWVPIAGATTASYTATTSDPGTHLRVAVTAKKAGYTTAVVTSDHAQVYFTDALSWFSPPTTTIPAAALYAAVGVTRTAVPGVLSVTGATYSYQWLANGTVIPGATAATFVPTTSVYGQSVSVRVTAAKAGYAPVSAETQLIKVEEGAAPTVVAGKQPKITGTLSQCTTLSVSTGTWTRSGLAFGYQWIREEEVVGTGPTYTLSAADAGASLSVVVTAAAYGYTDAQYLTASAAAVPLTGCL